MANVIIDNSNLTNIANAIRRKNKSETTYKPSEMAQAVLEINTDPSGDATATASDLLAPKTAYANGAKLTGTIPTKTDLDITSANGVVTIPAGYYAQQYQKQGDPSGDATATAANILAPKTAYARGEKLTGTIPTKIQSDITITGAVVDIPSGYYANNIELNPTSDANAAASDLLSGKTAYANGAKITGTISSKSAQTYTPTTTDQTISSGQYLSGAQTISGDANLVSSNIAQGSSIFGVSGSYTSDANATAAQILSGNTAYVNGVKLTGTITSYNKGWYKAPDYLCFTAEEANSTILMD